MDATKTGIEVDLKTRAWAWVLIVFLLASSLPRTVRADAATEREYQLKAAFLYNFIMFIDSPRFVAPKDQAEDDDSDEKKPVLIGIIGEDPFGEAFKPLRNKEVRDRPVEIKRFKGPKLPVDTDGPEEEVFPQLEAVLQCHVLFICASERDHLGMILRSLKGHSILTVADFPGSLESGCTINFIIEEKKVRFEINMASAQRAKLQVRSKLLRLARRVIKIDALAKQDGGENEAGTTEQ